MVVLLGNKIKDFVEKYIKINPAGVDITPKKIFRIPEEKIEYAFLEKDKRGYYISGKFYEIREVLEEIKPENDYWILDKGIYYLVFPKVKIPKNTIALALPRSTLNRLGLIKVETALFDPGYEGEFTQTWYIPFKLKVHINEAWVQLIFIKLEEEAEEYKGYWQKEKY